MRLAVHVTFAECEMRVTKQPPLQPFVGDADHDRGAASVTVSVRLSSGIDQLQVARADNAVQQQVEESVHGATPASVRPVVFPPLSTQADVASRPP
jgi:hypothetical protein